MMTMCAWCMRQYPFENPFGELSPWKDWATCPWAGGTAEVPRGVGRKPSLGNWVCGGWREEFETPSKMRDEMKKDTMPPKRVGSCRSRFIQMANEGRVPKQLRACDGKSLETKKN